MFHLLMHKIQAYGDQLVDSIFINNFAAYNTGTWLVSSLQDVNQAIAMPIEQLSPPRKPKDLS